MSLVAAAYQPAHFRGLYAQVMGTLAEKEEVESPMLFTAKAFSRRHSSPVDLLPHFYTVREIRLMNLAYFLRISLATFKGFTLRR